MWKTFIKRPSNIFTIKKCSPSRGERKILIFLLKLLTEKKCKEGRQPKQLKVKLKILPICCKEIRHREWNMTTPSSPGSPSLPHFTALSMHFLLTFFHPSSATGWKHLASWTKYWYKNRWRYFSSAMQAQDKDEM